MRNLSLILLFLLLIGCSSGQDIRVKYLYLMHERDYKEAFELLSDRIQTILGGYESFLIEQKSVDSGYDKKGIREEVLNDYVKLDGNILTFRTRTSIGNKTVILEGRIYMVVLNGKIDWIYSLGQPRLITEESVT